MRKSSKYILAALLVLLQWKCFLPQARAQSWKWARTTNVGGDESWRVKTDNKGNIYTALNRFDGDGLPMDFGHGVTVPNSYTWFQSVWVKYDNAGNAIWAGGTSYGNTCLIDMAIDPSGNLIVFGEFTGPYMKIGSFTLTNIYSLGWQEQYFLAKISPAGTVLWALSDGNMPAVGGVVAGYDFVGEGGVTTDTAGNIYITSSFFLHTAVIGSITLTNTATGPYSNDVFIAKYTPSGTVTWATSFGGTDIDDVFDITVAATGDIYVCGAFKSPSMTVGPVTLLNPYTTFYGLFRSTIAYIARVSPAGALLWAQAAGADNSAFAGALAKDDSGNVYMTGGFGDTSISFGSVKITRTYPAAVPQNALFLVKYSPSNVVTWSKTIGAAHTQLQGMCVALGPCGQLWIAGPYKENANFDGTIIPWVPGKDPVFLIGYDMPTGSIIGYAGLRSGGDDQNGVACDNVGNVFLCGDYIDSAMRVGTDTLHSPISPGGEEPEGFFLAKMGFADTIYARTDTFVCGADSALLIAPAGYKNFQWDDGSSDSVRKVANASGTYYLYCAKCNTVLLDSFVISKIFTDSISYRHDTTICSDIDPITLSGSDGCQSWDWSTGSTDSSLVISGAGTYYIRSLCGCSIKIDTFHVTVTHHDTTFAHENRGICLPASSLTIVAPPGYASRLWNTGSTDSFIIAGAGTYVVCCSNPCKTLIDTVNVSSIPNAITGFNLSAEISCNDNSVSFINTSQHATNFVWDFGDGVTDITADPVHLYKPVGDTVVFTVTLHGFDPPCNGDSTVKTVVLYPPPPQKFLYNITADQVIPFGESTQLDVKGGWIYYWSPDNGSLNNPNINNPVASPLEKTTYTVYAYTHMGCLDSARVNIDITFTEEIIPSAFTPNADGLNDVFRVVNLQGGHLIEMNIYNRWGQLVFRTTDNGHGWDGTFQGSPQDIDVYNYYIVIERENHQMVYYKGNVTLVR